MSTRKEFNFKSPKKRKRIIMVKNQNNKNTQQPSFPNSNLRISRSKQSSLKTLNDIQSIMLYSG